MQFARQRWNKETEAKRKVNSKLIYGLVLNCVAGHYSVSEDDLAITFIGIWERF